MSTGIMYNQNPATAGDPAYGVAAKAFSIQYLKALYAKPGAWRYMRNFDADVSSFGESVALPSFPRLTAQDVTQSTGAFNYDNTSILQSSIVINHQKAVGYSVPENILLQSKIDIRSAFAAEAANAVADTIDHELVKLISSLSTNSTGTAAYDLTEAHCLMALQQLTDNYVPLTNPNDLCWVLPSSQFAAVHGLKSYAAYTINSGSSGAEGVSDVRASMETLFGIPVFFRNDSEMTVSSGKIGALFYRDSVGVAVQRMPSMRQPMPIHGTVNTELLCFALFGIDLIKEATAVKLLCK